MSIPFLSKAYKTNSSQSPAPVTIVSGLPRSGTSMMMKMLEAGGMEILTDHIRTADVSNPKGYYEFEKVKKLKEGDYLWLETAQGKAVKIISALLEHLPNSYSYRVIFMRRNMDEILASQKEMLIRRGEPTDKISDEKLSELYQKHLAKIEPWLARQRHFTVLQISYNDLLIEPAQNLSKVTRFLGGKLDTASMLSVIDQDLYRQRR